MPEDDPLKFWKDRIESGEPIATFIIEPPIRISILQGGAIQFESPMSLGGFEKAGVQRLILAVSPSILKGALEAIENNSFEYVELKRDPSGQQ